LGSIHPQGWVLVEVGWTAGEPPFAPTRGWVDGGRTAVRPYKRVFTTSGGVWELIVPSLTSRGEPRRAPVGYILFCPPAPLQCGGRGAPRANLFGVLKRQLQHQAEASLPHSTIRLPALQERKPCKSLECCSAASAWAEASLPHSIIPLGAHARSRICWGNSPPASKLLRRTVVPCIGRVHRAGEPHSTPRRLRNSAFCADN
jgi:hypothetical protein